jgi:hypothetical protein
VELIRGGIGMFTRHANMFHTAYGRNRVVEKLVGRGEERLGAFLEVRTHA